jgi:hypothetical protein
MVILRRLVEKPVCFAPYCAALFVSSRHLEVTLLRHGPTLDNICKGSFHHHVICNHQEHGRPRRSRHEYVPAQKQPTDLWGAGQTLRTQSIRYVSLGCTCMMHRPEKTSGIGKDNRAIPRNLCKHFGDLPNGRWCKNRVWSAVRMELHYLYIGVLRIIE